MTSNLAKKVLGIVTLTTAPFLVLLFRQDFSPYSLEQPIFWQLLSYSFAGIFGYIGAILLFWQFILGLRFISSKFSNDTVEFNKIHKFLGIFGVLFALLHPFLMMYGYGESLAFVFLPDTVINPLTISIGLGRMAFLFLLIIWVTSAFLRKKIGFRAWKIIHFLAYPIMGLVLAHAWKIGHNLNNIPLLKIIWLGMISLFTIIVVYRLLKLAGLLKYKYKLVNKYKVEPDIYIYELKPLYKAITPKVGQFCYLQIKGFGEEHPFTIMEYNSETNLLKFGIKAQGKFTKLLSTLDVNSILNLDGPYGVFTIEGHNANPKVLIAGGIGITPFVDLVKKYSSEETYLIYANRYINNAVHRDLFTQNLEGRYYDVISEETNINEQNVIKGYLSGDILNKILPKEILNNADYFICGSKPFYNNCKNILLGFNTPKLKIHYEEFGL